jgi:hypothetical protein
MSARRRCKKAEQCVCVCLCVCVCVCVCARARVCATVWVRDEMILSR